MTTSEPELTPYRMPKDGVPAVARTRREFQEAVGILNQGYGDLAIDVERSPAVRFDERAFLIQIRRQGATTVMLAPERDRPGCTEVLAPLLNNTPWILHSAVDDLPCMAMLGLKPPRLFDTEVAARMCNLKRSSLAATVATMLGYELEKGHAREDWSLPELPESWCIYAALDVELLFELRDALAGKLEELGRTAWAEEEFASIVERHSFPPEPPFWRDIKGIHLLGNTTQLAIAKALHEHRMEVGWRKDKSIHRVLSNQVLIEIARRNPPSLFNYRQIPGAPFRHRPRAEEWFAVIEQARQSDSKPSRKDPRKRGAPPRTSQRWKQRNPQAHLALTYTREAVETLAAEHGIALNLLCNSSEYRSALWELYHQDLETEVDLDTVRACLLQHGVRNWQADLIAQPMFDGIVFAREHPVLDES